MSGYGDIAAATLVLVATAFLTVAVVGMMRVPNTRVKVHAISMGVVLGSLLALAATVATGDIGLIVRALLVGAFLTLTAPIAAHAILRLEGRREADEE